MGFTQTMLDLHLRCSRIRLTFSKRFVRLSHGAGLADLCAVVQAFSAIEPNPYPSGAKTTGYVGLERLYRVKSV